MLGIWKNYEELEDNLSMPELMKTLDAKREAEYNKRKFLAALQGVDLDEAASRDSGTSSFDDIKARVFSGGAAKDSSDILSMQGINAQQAGFGIGMGLDYTDGKDLENPSW